MCDEGYLVITSRMASKPFASSTTDLTSLLSRVALMRTPSPYTCNVWQSGWLPLHSRNNKSWSADSLEDLLFLSELLILIIQYATNNFHCFLENVFITGTTENLQLADGLECRPSCAVASDLWETRLVSPSFSSSERSLLIPVSGEIILAVAIVVVVSFI